MPLVWSRLFRSVLPSRNTNSYILFSTKVSQAMQPVTAAIKAKLTKEFQPQFLEVINESHMHNVPKGSESHFKLVVVSSKFENESLLQRHRMVHNILKEELTTGVHALSIIAKTPDQWGNSSQTIDPSPPCRGGAGL